MLESSPKVLVISSIPPRKPDDKPGESWADLSEIIAPNHRKYCEQWSYSYHLDVSDLWERVRPTKRGRPMGASVPIRYKIKFLLFQHFLDPDSCKQDWDWVVWIDHDLLITNYDTPLDSFFNGMRPGNNYPCRGDIVLTHDINSLHATVIMMRRTPYTLGFAYANGESAMRYYMEDDWADQRTLRMMLAYPPYSDMVEFRSVKELCAMHPGIYTQLPRIAREPYEWDEKESWALHLSALTLPKRIEIAKQYVEKYNLL